MALSTRGRWMLYGLGALLTAAAMVAVQPSEDAIDAPAIVPSSRPDRAGRDRVPVPELPQRSYAGAGRSPFGDAPAGGRAPAAPPAPEAAPLPHTADPAPAAAAATEPLFIFLGRWTEGGETIVFLAHGNQRLTARAGRLLTPEYRVESVGERELRVFHLPTRSRRTLALAAGGTASPTHGSASTAAPPEELN